METMDKFTKNHLREWCNRRFDEPVMASIYINDWLNEKNEDEVDYFIRLGWSGTYDHFCDENEETYLKLERTRQ